MACIKGEINIYTGEGWWRIYFIVYLSMAFSPLILSIISEYDGEYYIKMTVQYMKTKFILDLIVVYRDAQPDIKARFLAELSRVLHDCINHVLIEGDLNIIRKASKKNKPRG